MSQDDRNLTWHEGLINRADRNRFNGHKSGVVWMTGYSASGKSTLAHAMDKTLFESRVRVYVLDGDNVRHGLNRDLGFTAEARTENLRRVSEVAKLFCDAGIVVFTAFISPYRSDRDLARQTIGADDFHEVYVKCPIEVCESRDPKGIYKKVRAGKIAHFTGISDPYEEPLNPDVVLDTDRFSPEECVQQLTDYLRKKELIHRD
ncbi:MAG: adenylyl-sulfate kinase [Nitrospirota bacterium]|nr:adenylyl-sulfate kinase [Nitrospirota bacterium]